MNKKIPVTWVFFAPQKLALYCLVHFLPSLLNPSQALYYNMSVTVTFLENTPATAAYLSTKYGKHPANVIILTPYQTPTECHFTFLLLGSRGQELVCVTPRFATTGPEILPISDAYIKTMSGGKTAGGWVFVSNNTLTPYGSPGKYELFAQAVGTAVPENYITVVEYYKTLGVQIVQTAGFRIDMPVMGAHKPVTSSVANICSRSSDFAVCAAGTF